MIQSGSVLKAFLCMAGLVYLQLCRAQDTPKRTTNKSINAVKDEVRLKNGDRLTGELIRVRRGELYFDSDLADELTIDLKDIESITGRMNLYRMDIINKGLYAGKLNEAGEAGYFWVTHRADTLRFSFLDIAWLRRYKNAFLQQLEGSFAAGYTYTKAGGFNPITISNQLLYTTEHWQAHQSFSGIYPAADGGGFERIDANTGLRYLISNRWMALTQLQAQRILELGVNWRLLNMTGASRRLVESRHVRLDAGTGIALQKESATGGKVSTLQAELPAVFDFQLFQLGKPDINISANGQFFYNLSVANRYRANFSLLLTYEIVADFTIGTQFYYNYDSRPLLNEHSYADFGNVLTIGYSF